MTLVYEAPGMVLTIRGKANDGGAEGDVISVLNEQSKRVVQGMIIGPGRVAITTGSPRLAANNCHRIRQMRMRANDQSLGSVMRHLRAVSIVSKILCINVKAIS